MREGEQIKVVQPSLAEWMKIEDRHQILDVLNELAFEAHASQPEQVGTADIPEEKLVQRLLAIARQREVDLVRLVDFLSQRAGLLIPRGVGVYTFPHRTFQEYLAACHLTRQEQFTVKTAGLVRSDPNRWREVALLAGAKASRGAAELVWLLVDELCPREVKEADITQSDLACAMVAGQAIVETAALKQRSESNQRRVDRVRGWLKHILAPSLSIPPNEGEDKGGLPAVERVAAGDLLARLGDDRLGVGLRADGLPDIAWMDIEAGPFLMGSDKNKDDQTYDDEMPQHEVTLPAFQISRYPVTNAHYQAFVDDGGYSEKWRHCWTEAGWNWKGDQRGAAKEGGAFDLANHPVVAVTWYEAVAFCRWLSERSGQVVRLPTEAEWEKAARGTDGRIYPWGDEAGPERMNYSETGIGTTSAVGCFGGGGSPSRCQDMSGNVLEWCATVGGKSYPYDVTEDEWSEEYLAGTNVRVLRGGAFSILGSFARAPARIVNFPNGRYDFIGFRLVRAPI